MANLSTGEVGIESNMKSSYQQGIYGPKLTSYFRVAAGGCLTVDWPEKSTFAITRISSDIGLSDFTEPVPPGPAMLMAVAIKPIAAKDFQHRFQWQGCEDTVAPSLRNQRSRRTRKPHVLCPFGI